MNYNTERPRLKVPEFGRNVQSLVDFCLTIEDDAKRQTFAEGIIKLMHQMSPQIKGVEEYDQKLWNHLLFLADYKLNVESPYPFAGRKEDESRPDPVPYPTGKIAFKHYGLNVEKMIASAIAMEDEEKRIGYTEVVGNYMKMVYNNSNRAPLNDEAILRDIRKLSDGKLDLPDGTTFDALVKNARSSTSSNQRRKSGGKRHGGQNRNKRKTNNRRRY